MKLTKSLILLLFVAVLGFSFTSCSDDDDDALNRHLSKFTGTWELGKIDQITGLTDKFKRELEVANQKDKIKEYEDAMKAFVVAAGEELKPATLMFSADGKFEYVFHKLVDGKSTEVKQSGTCSFNETFTEVILKTTSEEKVSDKSYALVGASLLRQDDKKQDIIASVPGLEFETEIIKENEVETEVERVKVETAILGLVFNLKK